MKETKILKGFQPVGSLFFYSINVFQILYALAFEKSLGRDAAMSWVGVLRLRELGSMGSRNHLQFREGPSPDARPDAVPWRTTV